MKLFNKVDSKRIPSCNEDQLSWLIKNNDYKNDRILFILKYLYDHAFDAADIVIIKKFSELMNELIDIVSLQDNSKYIMKIGGLNILLGLILHSKNDNVIKKSCWVLVDLSSKNVVVQNYLTKIGIFKLLSYINTLNLKYKNFIENFIKVIYSVVVGENLNSKKYFIKNNGLDITFKILIKETNNNIFNKISNLLIDFLELDSYNILKQSNVTKVLPYVEKYYCTKYLGKNQKLLFEKLSFINQNFEIFSFNCKENYIKLVFIFIKNSFEIKNELEFFTWKTFIQELKKFLSQFNDKDPDNELILDYSNKLLKMIKFN